MSTSKYTLTAVRLHWLIAVLIAGAFAMGHIVGGMPLSPLKLKVFSWHKWAGVTIFLLVVVRLAWRAGHVPPAPPASMSAAQHRLAVAAHLILYLLMFAIPLTGWLMSSAKGFPTVYFGLIALPDLLSKNPPLGETLENVHAVLNWLLLVAVAGHAAAALKHHVIDKDDVLVRMLPFLGRSRSSL